MSHTSDHYYHILISELFLLGFTNSQDVIGHELTHGVTQFTSGLEYEKQPGALRIYKAISLKQSAQDADWLIGAEIMGPSLKGQALVLYKHLAQLSTIN
ncbi:hypothetical protein [Fictibacillus enclensis]|uniref:hypothetical protein n=1 Tax=Fictibacillus enclensis TaxID=1017270 RepID=UPI0025A2F62B|nr:hypothetical protein [Fictibacillus enclensis]